MFESLWTEEERAGGATENLPIDKRSNQQKTAHSIYDLLVAGEFADKGVDLRTDLDTKRVAHPCTPVHKTCLIIPRMK